MGGFVVVLFDEKIVVCVCMDDVKVVEFVIGVVVKMFKGDIEFIIVIVYSFDGNILFVVS